MNNYSINTSPIAGQGAFAARLIFANEIIGLAFVCQHETGNPDNDYTRTQLGRFANHSATPNMRLKIEAENIYFVATRDIEKEKELTINYHEFPWEGKRRF